MKRNIHFFILVLLFFNGNLFAQNELQFHSLDSLLQYAKRNSSVIKSGDQQALLAKWTRLAALGNTVNLRSPISANWTYNSELPVNYIPAEVFGGPVGTVKELAFGQTYVSNYGFTPQLDLINPAAWAKIKNASLNEELTKSTNLLAQKNLFESIAAVYYTIISMQMQVVALVKDTAAADSILQVLSEKQKQGIVREQEKNNAAITLLNLKDRTAQLISSLEQQYNSLKLLCDLKEDSKLSLSENFQLTNNMPASVNVSSSLLQRQQVLQSNYLKSELRSSRLLCFAPTVSLLFNQAWQRSSNTGFFDVNANHFSTQYVGLKISVPFPFDVSRLTQNYTSKINYSLSKLASEHSELQNETNNAQLELEYQKALSGYITSQKVLDLKETNYQKSKNQYSEGILSTDNFLLAFTDKVNADLNFINALSNLGFTKSKININNTIQ